MSQREIEDIKHKELAPTLVASTRRNPKDRKELHTMLKELAQLVPPEKRAGPPFCIIMFVTSIKDGFDAEMCFPVTQAVEVGDLTTQTLPGLQVLSLVHKGPAEDLSKSYAELYGYATTRGLMSDEFCREVFWDLDDEKGPTTEIQFVVHPWNDLLSRSLTRVLGENAAQQIMQGSDELVIASTVDDRFRWTKGAMERLEGLAREEERYDILSSCAHVFPERQIDKLRAVFQETMARTGSALEAVDATIAFMEEDPGWLEPPRREDRVIYTAKKPRDAETYDKAESEADKKKAYCFCPLVREHLNNGMPHTFCYCGSGWYRQQWEGATGKPVTVEIVRSILEGDERCEFAIRLSDDLYE